MKYAVLLYHDQTLFDRLPEAEQAGYVRAHDAFEKAVAERGTSLVGLALQTTDTATTLRHDRADRPMLTDGPFAETTEQLGGLYLVEAPDLDVVMELCHELPHAYTVEIRPALDLTPVYDKYPDPPGDT